MSLAKELHINTPTETKDLVVDCAGDLPTGETITAITGTVHSPNGLTITGVAVNAVAITEPGHRPIGKTGEDWGQTWFFLCNRQVGQKQKNQVCP